MQRYRIRAVHCSFFGWCDLGCLSGRSSPEFFLGRGAEILCRSSREKYIEFCEVRGLAPDCGAKNTSQLGSYACTEVPGLGRRHTPLRKSIATARLHWRGCKCKPAVALRNALYRKTLKNLAIENHKLPGRQTGWGTSRRQVGDTKAGAVALAPFAESLLTKGLRLIHHTHGRGWADSWISNNFIMIAFSL